MLLLRNPCGTLLCAVCLLLCVQWLNKPVFITIHCKTAEIYYTAMCPIIKTAWVAFFEHPQFSQHSENFWLTAEFGNMCILYLVLQSMGQGRQLDHQLFRPHNNREATADKRLDSCSRWRDESTRWTATMGRNPDSRA